MLHSGEIIQKSVEQFVYLGEALDSPASNKQNSTPVWICRGGKFSIQVMNALLILDAKEIVQISPKDKSETPSSNMSARRMDESGSPDSCKYKK